jgi:hypothetical protein
VPSEWLVWQQAMQLFPVCSAQAASPVPPDDDDVPPEDVPPDDVPPDDVPPEDVAPEDVPPDDEELEAEELEDEDPPDEEPLDVELPIISPLPSVPVPASE